MGADQEAAAHHQHAAHEGHQPEGQTLYGMTLLGVVIGAYAWRWSFASAGAAWRAGGLWLLLTVAFEFIFFHYVTGHSWEELLANYDLAAGRLWPVLLLWIAIAPAVFRRLWQRREAGLSSRHPPAVD